MVKPYRFPAELPSHQENLPPVKNSTRSAARFTASVIAAQLGPSADHFLIRTETNPKINFPFFLPLQSDGDQNLRAERPREEKVFPLGGESRRDVIRLIILLHLRHYELSAIHTTQLTGVGGGMGGVSI